MRDLGRIPFAGRGHRSEPRRPGVEWRPGPGIGIQHRRPCGIRGRAIRRVFGVDLRTIRESAGFRRLHGSPGPGRDLPRNHRFAPGWCTRPGSEVRGGRCARPLCPPLASGVEGGHGRRVIRRRLGSMSSAGTTAESSTREVRATLPAAEPGGSGRRSFGRGDGARPCPDGGRRAGPGRRVGSGASRRATFRVRAFPYAGGFPARCRPGSRAGIGGKNGPSGAHCCGVEEVTTVVPNLLTSLGTTLEPPFCARRASNTSAEDVSLRRSR